MKYSMTFRVVSPGPIPPQRREPGQHGAPDSPIRADFPDGPEGAKAYVVAWRAWLHQSADGVLTPAERDVRAALYAEMFDVPVQVARHWPLRQLQHFATLDPDLRAIVLAAAVDAYGPGA
jgi:hypothetical protein